MTVVQSRVTVVSPTPVLTVTVESGSRAVDEIHYHAGGQGVWVARMAARLGAEVVLCALLGGESGQVLRGLIEVEGFELRAIQSGGANPSYVHDRRGGERVTVASSPAPILSRHELDELYGLALATGLDAGVTLLTGSAAPGSDFFRRLAADLRSNGATVAADLSEDALRAVLSAGVDLLKVSHEEAIAAGYALDESEEQAVAAARALHEDGARDVLLSRAERPALALVGGRLFRLVQPRFAPLDERGAGDSMFATAAVTLASDRPVEQALRLAMAAGALNVTRHGLGTGREPDITEISSHVEIEVLAGDAAPVAHSAD